MTTAGKALLTVRSFELTPMVKRTVGNPQIAGNLGQRFVAGFHQLNRFQFELFRKRSLCLLHGLFPSWSMSTSSSLPSPLSRVKTIDVAERGRSLGVILISAQQFMSAVHPRVTGNSATKIIGRTGSSEVNAPDYRFLDQDIRSSVTRLAKGDLLISHAVYRQPVKVTFPRAAYQQQQP